MHHNLKAQTNQSSAAIKLFVADVHLPKTSWFVTMQ